MEETVEQTTEVDRVAFVDTQLDGILDPFDVADELEEMYVNGLPPGASTGFFNLDGFYTVALGQWTILTGIPGSGKSTALDNLLVNLSKQHGWKHLYCSPENQPIKLHIANLAAIYAGKSFDSHYMSREDYAEAVLFVQENFKFIYPPEQNFTINYILDLADVVKENGFDYQTLSIDPYNELEHKRPNAMTETEYISMMLSRFRRNARDRNTHNFLVAHPTKLKKIEMKFTKEDSVEEMTKSVYPVATLYDIAGSAHFFNKADNGLSIWRDKSDTENRVQIHVQKIRFRNCGKLGMCEMKFDWKSGKYTESY